MVQRNPEEQGILSRTREMADGGRLPEMHMVDDPGCEAEPSKVTRRAAKPLPLNSKHLKVLHIMQIAVSMIVPIAGCANEVQQMIEERLADMGMDPGYVQVLVPEAEGAHL